MNNSIYLLPLVLLISCTTVPKYEPLSVTEVEFAFNSFLQKDGTPKKPLRGEFKSLSAEIIHESDVYWDCTDTNVRKTSEYMNFATSDTGQVTGNGFTNYCGSRVDLSLIGLQTKAGLYLTDKEKAVIKFYTIDEGPSRLTFQGNYSLKEGGFVLSPARKNNESWVAHGSTKSYLTTNFLPKESWAEVDKFDRNIVGKKIKGHSGFQWGKALALGVGTVAGGGLKLDSATQGSVLAGIVLDSMGDNEGVSNFEEAVGNAVQPSLDTSTPVSSAGSNFAIESNLSSQTQLATNQASSPTSNGTVGPQLYVISYSKCIVKLQRPDLDITDPGWLFTLYIWDYPNRIPAPARAEWQSINSQHATQSEAAIRRKVERIVRDGGYAYDSKMRCDGGYGPSSDADYIQEQIDKAKATYERFKANPRKQVHWFRGN